MSLLLAENKIIITLQKRPSLRQPLLYFMEADLPILRITNYNPGKFFIFYAK